MKRYPELEREILLAIEADEGDEAFPGLSGISGFGETQIGYHVILLHEAGLIVACDMSNATTSPVRVASTGDRYDWKPLRLTMAGHEYLELIRNPEVWRQTKAGAEKVGSFSLDLLRALAKCFIGRRTEKLVSVKVSLDQEIEPGVRSTTSTT